MGEDLAKVVSADVCSRAMNRCCLFSFVVALILCEDFVLSSCFVERFFMSFPV